MNDPRFQVSPPLSGAVRTRRAVMDRGFSFLDGLGYEELEVPLLAPFDDLRSALGPEVSARLFRFIDRDGTMLVLRGDLTPVVARQLAGLPTGEPLRVAYAARVARVQRAFARERVESYALGLELVGEAGLDADATLIVHALGLLEHLGIGDVEVAVGDVRITEGLLDAANLDGPDRAALARAVLRRDPAHARDLALHLDAPLREALVRACALTPTQEDLRKIGEAGPAATQVGASALSDLVATLEARGYAGRVALDLGAQDDRGYYTGARFSVRCPRASAPLASGGRYDKLFAHFGADRPAVGVGFDVDQLVELCAARGGAA